MMADYIDELINRLIDVGIATSDAIEPCTPEQIANIEKSNSISLPKSYKIFLSKMGSKAGTFMRGTDFYYRHLPKLRGCAEELLKEWDCSFTLSETDFVFLCHQGSQFMYFDTATGDDPPIYHYKEAQYEPQKVNDSFSNWLQCRVNEAVKIEELRKSLKA